MTKQTTVVVIGALRVKNITLENIGPDRTVQNVQANLDFCCMMLISFLSNTHSCKLSRHCHYA